MVYSCTLTLAVLNGLDPMPFRLVPTTGPSQAAVQGIGKACAANGLFLGENSLDPTIAEDVINSKTTICMDR